MIGERAVSCPQLDPFCGPGSLCLGFFTFLPLYLSATFVAKIWKKSNFFPKNFQKKTCPWRISVKKAAVVG